MNNLIKNLENKIKNSYEEGVTIEVAERLAGEFLHAQMLLSAEMRKTGLDARMRKSGVKAIRAAIYMEGATKGDKKPSDVLLQAQVDMNDLVMGEQKSYDESEENFTELQRYYDIFTQAHVYFRQLAKAQ